MVSDLADRLKSEGWIQQFTASGSRLQEAIDNYRMLGFEVKTVPMRELGQNGCAICFENENDETVMVFTRKNPSASNDSLEP